MNDDGLIQLAREPDLAAKHRLLHVARREVVVIVQADLTERALETCVRRAFDDRLQIVRERSD